MSAPLPMLNNLRREDVAELLNYDPGSGVFYWRVRRGQRIKPGDVAGSPNSEGYRSIVIDSQTYKAHRLAWLLTHGEWPNGEIDHINGKRDDNRLSNLRCVSKSHNQHNRKLNSDNKSGHIGVCINNAGNRWVAQIGVNGKQRYLGAYHTVEEAAAAYRAAKAELHPDQPMAREPRREAA